MRSLRVGLIGLDSHFLRYDFPGDTFPVGVNSLEIFQRLLEFVAELAEQVTHGLAFAMDDHLAGVCQIRHRIHPGHV